ncbi:MAG: hypothetical protein HY430_03390 [Candidatus Levybacteria bacterium]|nr:hypothetical protein [Candidatus Levybacteria bacterium]
MKALYKSILIGLSVILVLFLALEILIYRSNYQGENLTKKDMKSCSWIDAVPNDWKCKDNWDGNNRVIKAEDGEKYFQLMIVPYTERQKASRPCTPLLPEIIPHRPSASGITLPMWCFGQGTYQLAEWEQDGFFFQFLAYKAPTNLYLHNLRTIGWFDL